MEILEHAKATERPLIFITSDTKEDWWWRHGQSTVGPRPELVQEIAGFASVRFYMYSVERFLSEAQKRVDTKVESTEVKKAAAEFKDIESKKQSKLDIDAFSADLAYLWEQRALLDAKHPQAIDVRGALARYFRQQVLETRPASDATKLTVEEWVQAIEDMESVKLSSSQTAILQEAINSKMATTLAEGTTSLKDAVRGLFVYIYLNDAVRPK
jgi:hypothetical protein